MDRAAAAAGGKLQVHGIVLGASDNKSAAPCQLFDVKGNLIGSGIANLWITNPAYTNRDAADLLSPTAGREFLMIDGYWSSVPDRSVKVINGVTYRKGVAVTPATRTKAIVKAEMDAAASAGNYDAAGKLKAEFESLTV